MRLKFAQCPNCGLIHRVTDVAKSDILKGKEQMTSLLTIDEIKASLSEPIVAALEANDVDYPTWEAAKFIVENERWGEHVVLSREHEGDEVHIKYLRFLGVHLIKVDTEVLEAYAKKDD